MTTENIDIPVELEQALGRVGSQLASRRIRIRSERTGALRHEANIATGAAVMIKRSKDTREELDHEEEQLDDVERMASVFRTAIDGETDGDDEPGGETDEDFLDYLYTRAELEEMSTDDLFRLATEIYDFTYHGPQLEEDAVRQMLIDYIVEQQAEWCAQNGEDDPNQGTPPPPPVPPVPDPDLYTRAELEDEDVTSLDQLVVIARWYVAIYPGFLLLSDEQWGRRDSLVAYILMAQARWCNEHDEVDPNNRRRRQVNVNPRNWRWLAWLLAVVGAFIGLWIGWITKNPLWEHNGLGQTLWVIALIGVGFFGGGVIGNAIEGD